MRLLIAVSLAALLLAGGSETYPSETCDPNGNPREECAQ